MDALQTLPSIGKKSALRLAFHMVLSKPMDALKLAHTIEEAVSSLHPCVVCGGLSENELCHICSDPLRDKSKLCLVESAKDICIIEESNEYDGLFFVFDRINEQTFAKLKEIVEKNGVEEIIFAFTPSMQSEATMLYIEDQLQEYDLTFTKIAQGVPTGVNLENVDMLSLSKAISERVKI